MEPTTDGTVGSGHHHHRSILASLRIALHWELIIMSLDSILEALHCDDLSDFDGQEAQLVQEAMSHTATEGMRSAGDEAMSHMLESGIVRLPKGFWPACCYYCFKRQCTDALRKSLSKSLCLYMHRVRQGATTQTGMLGEKRPHQKRSSGGAMNATKCPELGQFLYDWFIDCLQIYIYIYI